MEGLNGPCLGFFYTFAQEGMVWHGAGVGLNQHTWGVGGEGFLPLEQISLGAMNGPGLGKSLALSVVACSPWS